MKPSTKSPSTPTPPNWRFTAVIACLLFAGLYVLVTHGYFFKLKHQDTTVEFAPSLPMSAGSSTVPVLVGNR